MKLASQKLLFSAIAIGALVIFGRLALNRVQAEPVSRTQYIMGTLIEITVYGKKVEPAIEAAFDRMRDIERQVGPDEASDISRLNLQAGDGMAIPVRLDTWNILQLAAKYWRSTAGAFDVTVGPLVDLWGFGYGGEGSFPAPSQITQTLPKVGGNKLLLNPRLGTARLAKAGMAITVGGIAKGYAVEGAMKVLQARGVKNAMINGGSSSIMVIGPGIPGRGWRVGIEDPRHSGKMLGVIRLQSGDAIGTSADDQRFFIKDGKRYSHIIDPRTGYPTDKKIALVSVITRNATVADILTKALFLNKPEWSLRFLRKQKLEALLVSTDGTVRTTPGFRLEQ